MSIVTRKEKRELTHTEEYVRDLIDQSIRSIDVNNITYLDEIYTMLDARKEALQRLGDVEIPLIDDMTAVETALYNTMARDIREMSNVNIGTITDSYKMLQKVSDDIFSFGETITSSLSICDQLMSKVEGTLKRKMSLESIKDEITVYDSFLNDENVYESTLGMDYYGGFVTLKPKSREKIPITIKSIEVNKQKGKVSRPRTTNNSLDFFTDGYFHSRTFSSNPSLEIRTDYNESNITDNLLRTNYIIEYNSLLSTDMLSANIKLDLTDTNGKARRVDHLVIELTPGERTSVISTERVLPYISEISTDQENITSEILDNRIDIRGAAIGKMERGFGTVPTSTYPAGSLALCKKEVEEITVGIVADTPQTIWFPEKVLQNDTGNTLRILNYFETLIVNGYEPVLGRPDPSDLYTKSEIDEFKAVAKSAYYSYDRKTTLNRYAIEIKDISAYTAVYNATGYSISNNLNQYPERKVAGVEVYSNEIIPEGTFVEYYISHDRVVWHQVVPINRGDDSDVPTRIVYGGLDLRENDKHINVESSDVYLKIMMRGGAEITPRLKSYAVRIKLI